MYIDVTKKIELEKERIVKEFIKTGICPSQNEVNEKIAQIDMYLSLFKHYDKESGRKFDVDEYNAATLAIYNDIKILYGILIDFLEKEYLRQQNFIRSHLAQLDSLTQMCYKQALHESSSSTIGMTLLFKNREFTVETKDNITFIDLGDIAIKEASEIICLANINNCDHDNIIFEFENLDTGEVITTTAYNKYNESIKFPGKKEVETYTTQLDSSQKTDEIVLINTGATVDIKNKYTILGGKNNIQYNGEIVKVPSVISEYRFVDGGHINFYIMGGNTASFKFNKKPISSNFILNDHIVRNLNDIHHFFIDAPKDFQFSIEIDKGDIYAVNESGIVNGKELFYIGDNAIKDFLVIEEKEGKRNLWNARLKIADNNEDKLLIEEIIIKEVGD